MDRRDLVHMLQTNSSSPVAFLPLPGQVPGPRILEHDTRVETTIEVWDFCFWHGFVGDVLLTSGLQDRNGLTGAEYLRNQFTVLAYAGHMERQVRQQLLRHLVVAEQESCYTADSLLRLRPFLLSSGADGRIQNRYQTLVLISNAPHLRVASVYARRFLRGMRIVCVPSGDGRGALNLPYEAYCRREMLHLLGARIDLTGGLLNLIQPSYAQKLRDRSSALEWPPIASAFPSDLSLRPVRV